MKKRIPLYRMISLVMALVLTFVSVDVPVWAMDNSGLEQKEDLVQIDERNSNQDLGEEQDSDNEEEQIDADIETTFEDEAVTDVDEENAEDDYDISDKTGEEETDISDSDEIISTIEPELFDATFNGATVGTVVDGGTYAQNPDISWKLIDKGTTFQTHPGSAFYSELQLVISGTGAMPDLDLNDTLDTVAPWWDTYGFKIREIVVEEGITHIGDYTLSNLDNIYYDINIPNSVESIGAAAFHSTKSRGGIFFAEDSSASLKTIGKSAFALSKFAGSLYLPDSIEKIDEKAFNSMSISGGIRLPENPAFTTIEEKTFEDIDGIREKISIPRNVTTIKANAFRRMGFYSNEVSIFVPKEVTSIGEDAFYCRLGGTSDPIYIFGDDEDCAAYWYANCIEGHEGVGWTRSASDVSTKIKHLYSSTFLTVKCYDEDRETVLYSYDGVMPNSSISYPPLDEYETSKEGMKFLGWYIMPDDDSEATSKFLFKSNYQIKKSFNLVAKYSEKDEFWLEDEDGNVIKPGDTITLTQGKSSPVFTPWARVNGEVKQVPKLDLVEEPGSYGVETIYSDWEVRALNGLDKNDYVLENLDMKYLSKNSREINKIQIKAPVDASSYTGPDLYLRFYAPYSEFKSYSEYNYAHFDFPLSIVAGDGTDDGLSFSLKDSKYILTMDKLNHENGATDQYVWEKARLDLWKNGSTHIYMDEETAEYLNDMSDENYADYTKIDWVQKYVMGTYDGYEVSHGYEGDYMWWHGNVVCSQYATESSVVGTEKLYSFEIDYYLMVLMDRNVFVEKEQYVDDYIKNLVKPGGILDPTKWSNDGSRAKAAYDWVVNNVKYNSGYDSDIHGGDAEHVYYWAYAGLTEGKGSCECMAQIYYYICKEMGLNVRIIGNNGLHIYNMVQVGNAWYYVDCSAKKCLKGTSSMSRFVPFEEWIFEGTEGWEIFKKSQLSKIPSSDFSSASIPKFNVAFNANGGSGSMPKNSGIEVGSKFTLPKNKFTRAGYSFSGWSTTPNGDVEYTDCESDIDFDAVNGQTVNLYAQWKSIDYVIFFDANGGDDGTLNKNDTALLNFENVDEIRDTGINLPNDDNLANGFLQVMKYDENIVLSGDEFVKRGYTLSGWKNSKTGKVVRSGTFSKLTTQAECVTLTAQWTKNTYSLKYNLNGGAFNRGYKALASYTVDSGVDPENYLTTAAIQLPTADNISRKGYVFEGWYDNKNLEGYPIAYIRGNYEDDLELMSYNLYAKWSPITYNVSFKGNGAGATADIENESLLYDETYTIPVFSRPGYKFASWNTVATPTKETPGKKLTSKTIKNLTVNDGDAFEYYAQWTANSYKIGYSLDGGKISGQKTTYTSGVGVDISSLVPVKTGYTFVGWSLSMKDGSDIPGTTSKELTNVVAIDTDMYGDVVLKANWDENSYQVNYYVNKSGFLQPTSSGWNTDDDGVYLTKHYTYSELINMDTVAAEIESEVASADSSIAAFTITNGRSVTNYALNKQYSKLKDIDSSEIKVFAKWGEKTYRISYDLSENAVIKNNPLSYKANMTKDLSIPNPTRTGFIFAGWEEVKGASDPSHLNTAGNAIAKGTSGDISLKAKWNTVHYKVVIKFNKKNTPDEIRTEVPYYPGDGMIIPYKQVLLGDKEGYTLIGLATDAKGKNLLELEGSAYDISGLTTKNNATVTLYAIWNANQYPINYDLQGGTVGKNAPTVSIYEKDISLVNPVKEGYTFLGWTTDTVDASLMYKTGTPYVTKIKKDNKTPINLIANWKDNLYTLKINSNSGVRVDTKKTETVTIQDPDTELTKLSYGKEYDLSENGFYDRYERKGYVLSGYALDANGKNMIDIGSPIGGLTTKNNGTVNIYAVWEKVQVVTPTILKITTPGTGMINVSYKGGGVSTAEARYEVQYSTSYNFRSDVTASSESSAILETLSDLQSDVVYYVRVREIKTDSQGNDIVSGWSTVKSIRTN